MRRIVTTNDARSAGGHDLGCVPRRSTKTSPIVLLVFALGTVVAVLLGASSPALAQEEGFQAFHESTIPAGRAAEATTPASNPETYPSAAQYQYEAPPGGRLMDTGGVGLIALLIGGVAALTVIGVLAIGTDDRSEEQRGGN